MHFKNIFLKSIMVIIFCSHHFLHGAFVRTFNNGNAQAVGLQTDGKIIAVGLAQVDNSTQLGLARYTSYGQLDLTFGNNGFVATLLGSQQLNANALYIDDSNRSVIVGSATLDDQAHLMIARFDSAGVLDTTFGNNGYNFMVVGDGATANGIVRQTDGKFVVAGATVVQGMPKLVITRFTSTGQLDTSFGDSGFIIVEIGSVASSNAIVLQSDGKIIAGGFSVLNGLQSFVLVRVNADGSLDSSFGDGGIVATPTGLGDAVRSMVIDSNGKITVGGSSGTNFGLVRYNSDGSVDTSFGSNGIVVKSIGSYSQINGIVLQQDGLIVAAGYSDSDFAVARFDVDGFSDPNFGTNGVVTTVLAGSDAAQALVLQSDGKIIAAGSAGVNYGLVRYNSDGSLDTSFGINGIVIAPNNGGAGVFGITDINIDIHANISYEKLNLSNSITNADIKTTAAIQDSKLATISTPGKILNQATTATPNNIAGSIAARDALGNIYANRVYANVNGNVVGYSTLNVLKAGDTMTGALILPAGTPSIPSLQFSGSTNSGITSVNDTLTMSTNGAAAVSISPLGNVTLAAPSAGVGLTVNGGGQDITGDVTISGDLSFNTASQTSYPIASVQASGVRLFTGSAITNLSGSVTINYADAGFANPPLIFTQAVGGAFGALGVSNVTATSALISNNQLVNTNFNYIAIGN